MTTLPRIPLPDPIIIPPTPQQEFPEAYILTLDLNTDSPFVNGAYADTPPQDLTVEPLSQSLSVTVQGFNYDLGLLSWHPNHKQTLYVSDIRGEAARSGLFAQTMGMVVGVTGLMMNERALLAALLADPANTTIRDQLLAIRSQLQITDNSDLP